MSERFDAYFMSLAAAAAGLSTCSRASVGCVLVRDRMVVATGYNGAPRGYAHCGDDHDMRDGHCTRAVHAEANAIASAARAGHRTDGASAYVSHYPCFRCASLLRNAGVVEVVYRTAYNPDPRVAALGLRIRQWTEPQKTSSET